MNADTRPTLLIADDDPTVRAVLGAQLAAHFRVIGTAADAPEAIGLAERHRPDAAPIDVDMPGGGAREALPGIAACSPGTRLVVLSADECESAVVDVLVAGATAYLRKGSIHLAELRDDLRVAVGLEATAPEGASGRLPSKSSGPASGLLLVAEDNLINQKVAVAMLSGAGYRVHTVLNGAEAVDAVARERYDAVLMDCQMPEMNGYEATALIREREGEGRQTPIIALTAGARANDRVRCFAAGMDHYLAKPVSKDALLALVARYVKKGPQTAQSLNDEVVAELEALEGDVLPGLVSQYLDEAAGQAWELTQAIGRGEASGVVRLAHKLKGSSCTVGAATVSHVASELERAAMAGDLTTADALMNRLRTGLDETRDAFGTRSAERGARDRDAPGGAGRDSGTSAGELREILCARSAAAVPAAHE